MAWCSPVGITPAWRSYGLEQQFITPHCPRQNSMVERVIPTQGEHASTAIASRLNSTPCA